MDTEKFCAEMLTWGKTLYTFESKETAHLIAIGVRSVTKRTSVQEIGLR
jgi:hypothetical protein